MSPSKVLCSRKTWMALQSHTEGGIRPHAPPLVAALYDKDHWHTCTGRGTKYLGVCGGGLSAPQGHAPVQHLDDPGRLPAALRGDPALEDQGGAPRGGGHAEHGLLRDPGRP